MAEQIDDRIAKLREKLKQAETLKRQIDARARAAASKKERADDTRRKILIGAYTLEKIERGEQSFDKLRIAMSTYLRRDDDRALFNLPPLPQADPTPVAPTSA